MDFQPWGKALDLAIAAGGGRPPLLLVGYTGCHQLAFAKEIHERTGGGPFEHVICSPNVTKLRHGLLSDTVPGDFLDDPGSKYGAVARASGGTLFLDFIEYSAETEVAWLGKLLSGQQVAVGRWVGQVQEDTRILACTNSGWLDPLPGSVPAWVRRSFLPQVVLEPIRDRPSEILASLDWFMAKTKLSREMPKFSPGAAKVLSEHAWAGDLHEIRSAAAAIAGSGMAIIEESACRKILETLQGNASIDSFRQMECRNYTADLVYMGRPTDPQVSYAWVNQFVQANANSRIDGWAIGATLLREMSRQYFYSADRLRQLLTLAFDRLAVALRTEVSIDLRTAPVTLFQPLSPLKSSSGLLPHISHLVNSSTVRVAVTVDEVLRRTPGSVIVYADDFVGTGGQVITEVLKPLLKQLGAQEGKKPLIGIVAGVAFHEGLKRISDASRVGVQVFAQAGVLLDDSNKAFTDSSSIFSAPGTRATAKELVVDKIGKSLWGEWPAGYGNMQSLVVTGDNTPNDTLPAVWKTGRVTGVEWIPLFPRSSLRLH